LKNSSEEFKEKGYYEHPIPEDVPEVMKAFEEYYKDPEKNRLNTPSGKIEIYSKKVADFFGEDHPTATAVPKYVPSPEGPETPLAERYPLFLTSPHPKLGRHSQWHNLSWHRDEYQVSIEGHNIMRINLADAKRRDIETGDVVRIYNDRGSILCAAYSTERIMPGVIRVPEGGWYRGLVHAAQAGRPGLPGRGREPEHPDIKQTAGSPVRRDDQRRSSRRREVEGVEDGPIQHADRSGQVHRMRHMPEGVQG
jgi:anaerobic selenocysteine-containing dehydrogenase